MEFCLLGPLAVRADGAVIQIPPGKQRALLAALLLNAGRVVPVGELAEALWGATPPPSARVTVQNYVMRLRHALGDAGRAKIATQPRGYLMGVDAAELDVSQFEVLLTAARAAARGGAWDVAAARSREALSLWRGEPLADVDSDVLALRAVPRLSELRVQALEARFDADLRLGGHAEVIADLQVLAETHPLRERLYALLMMALYRDGRRGEALAAYRHARQVLVNELGTEPGIELRELHRQILTSDPGLSRPMLPPAAASGSRRVAPRQLPAATGNFVGRVRELAVLDGLLDRPDGHTPETVVISAIAGTAGVGKTALAVWWAHRVAGRFPDGQLYVNLRGFDPSGTPVTPHDAIGRFLDALGVSPGLVPSGPQARENLYRSMLADKRMLILLDNARDAGQVRPLLPGGPGCLVVVTSRSQLASLVATDSAHLLTLDLLSEREAQELLARRLGRERVVSAPRVVSELIGLCARLPLAISIAAARAAAHPAFPLAAVVAELRDAGDRLDALDAGEAGSSVRAVLSWSYRNLSRSAARMFRLLSVHAGPDITGPAAASLAGLPRDQARRAVGELSRAHLLAEHAPGRFVFHDLLRAYAADQARAKDSPAECRAAMHRLLDHYLHTGQEIARLIDPTRDMISLAAPRRGVAPESVAGYRQAWTWSEAEHQVLLAAVSQAAVAGFEVHAWQICHTLEPFFFRRGRWHDLATVHHTALDAATRVGDVAGRAHTHHGLGRVHALLGSFDDAQAHLARAVAGYRQLGNVTGEARARISIGMSLRRHGRYSEALAQAEEALASYRATGNRAGQAGALNNIGFCHIYLGNCQQGLACCQEALSLFRQLGNNHGAGHALDSLGYAHHRMGHHAEAIACYRESLAAFREQVDRYSQAEALTHLGDSYDASGDPHAAHHAWRAALAILGDLSHPDAGQLRSRLGQPSSAQT